MRYVASDIETEGPYRPHAAFGSVLVVDPLGSLFLVGNLGVRLEWEKPVCEVNLARQTKRSLQDIE